MLLNSFGWNDLLSDEDINQRLQRLHIFLRQEIVVHRNSDKVNETTVQFQMTVDVPERIIPVIVVEVSVATEHLFDDGFEVLVIVLGKAGCFANPIIVGAGERSH